MIRTCDVLRAELIENDLVVIGTSRDRIHAAQLLTSEESRLTIPGTYLSQHLGAVIVMGSMEATEIARLLAESLFKDSPELLSRHYNSHLAAITASVYQDEPFIPVSKG